MNAPGDFYVEPVHALHISRFDFMKKCILHYSFAFLMMLYSGYAFGEVIDLRAEAWKRTTIANVGTGAVQYTGDDTKFGAFPVLLEQRIRNLPHVKASRIEVKTVDVRLSLPDAKIDRDSVGMAKLIVPAGAAFAPAFAELFSAFSKDKSASAVFCVAIDGKNYLGNDARLFRFGAEGELSDAIQAALQVLVKAIQADVQTTSPACDPGWEGGQARYD